VRLRPRRWWPLYVAWIALCAIVFAALAGAEDPSRPEGRILSIDAGRAALAIARERGMHDFEVVHVARARKGEGGDTGRWIVLLDKVPHTALAEAVVIELAEEDGRLLGTRGVGGSMSRQVDEGRRRGDREIRPSSP
jgi:hypothetical protein